jgi:hypothetical protein
MAISGVGTIFRRYNTTLQAWEDIGEIKSISVSGMQRATHDVTPLNVLGGYRKFVTGLRDAGQISLSMFFTRTTYDLMKADFESDVEKDYEILLPDTENTSIRVSGLVTETPLTIPEEAVTSDVTIKVSGIIVDDSGSAPSPT